MLPVTRPEPPADESPNGRVAQDSGPQDSDLSRAIGRATGAPSRPGPVLLLTRPHHASERFARAFRIRFGMDRPVLLAPLTEIRPTGTPMPLTPGLVFTSENAVGPAVAAHPAAGRIAYCVGKRTAATARAAGYRVIEGPGDGAGLAALIRGRWQHDRLTPAPPAEGPQAAGTPPVLLHVRGTETALPLARILGESGIATAEVIAYEQMTLPLSDAAGALLRAPGRVLAPVFSPASATRLAEALAGLWLPPQSATALSEAARPAQGARIWLVAISPAAAHAMHDIPAEQRETAAQPDVEGMLRAIARLPGFEQAG